MIRFALNYSDEAARLIRSGRISVDLIKCADFPEMIEAARRIGRVYVHFPVEVGVDRKSDLDAVARLRDETGTPFVNVHLVCRRRDWPEIDGHRTDGGQSELVRRRWLSELAPIVDRFGAESVVAENLIYHGRGEDDWLHPGTEPAVISAVVRESGCGLLMDLAHARIAAHYRGEELWSYLAAMPVERLRELHITGVIMHEGRLTDHLPMTERDWVDFEAALDQIARGVWGCPEIVACEYGGTGATFAWRSDEAVIAMQTPRMTQMVNGLNAAMRSVLEQSERAE